MKGSKIDSMPSVAGANFENSRLVSRSGTFWIFSIISSLKLGNRICNFLEEGVNGNRFFIMPPIMRGIFRTLTPLSRIAPPICTGLLWIRYSTVLSKLVNVISDLKGFQGATSTKNNSWRVLAEWVLTSLVGLVVLFLVLYNIEYILSQLTLLSSFWGQAPPGIWKRTRRSLATLSPVIWVTLLITSGLGVEIPHWGLPLALALNGYAEAIEVLPGDCGSLPWWDLPREQVLRHIGASVIGLGGDFWIRVFTTGMVLYVFCQAMGQATAEQSGVQKNLTNLEGMTLRFGVGLILIIGLVQFTQIWMNFCTMILDTIRKIPE